MKKSKKIIIILSIILALAIATCSILIILSKISPTTSTRNNKKNVASTTEFNTNVEKQYADILDQYFRLDAIPLYEYNNLARYPMAYQDTMVDIMATVEKVLEEKDNKYKILVSFTSFDEYDQSKQYLVLEGEYKTTRYLNGDWLRVYGVYKGNDTYNIDGANEVLPKINAVKIVIANEIGQFIEFNDQELREVANAFFGTTYTIKKPFYTCSDGRPIDCYLMGLPFHYLLTLDNNSNAKFHEYRIYPSGGRIDVATEQDSINLKRYINKSSDNKKFILSTYTDNNSLLELQLYDQDFKSIWTRQFKASSYLYHINNGKIALSIDNELYLLDEKTGENIIDPIIAPTASSLRLLADGSVILTTNTMKDFIIYITPDGKIKWKTSLENYDEYKSTIDGIYTILVANEKIYVCFYIANIDEEHVAVFSKDGKELVNTYGDPNH